MDILKDRVAAFFSYLEKVWMSPDLKNWFEAPNPMMCSTNNSLEAINNVFKRDFTGCMRVSMPNLVQKLKEFVKGWSKNPKETLDRVSTVSPAVKKSAEYLLNKFEDFLRFRKAKHNDRPTVKPKGDVVIGELKELGICPSRNYVVTTLPNYNEDAKNMVNRRRQIDYSDFDQFRKDLNEIVLMEVIELEDGLGKEEIFCNCFAFGGASGCKGDICVHVCARYCNVLYRTVLYCTVLNCIALYCTVLYFTVLYCTVLYFTVL